METNSSSAQAATKRGSAIARARLRVGRITEFGAESMGASRQAAHQPPETAAVANTKV